MITGPFNPKQIRIDRFKKVLKIFTIVLAVAVIAGAGYFAYDHFYANKNNQNPSTGSKITAKQFNNSYNQSVQRNLESGDYTSYQLFQVQFAEAYIGDNDYKSAKNTLNDVADKIPANKLMTDYYRVKLEVDKHYNDSNAITTDLAAMESLLKSKGLTQEAKSYQCEYMPSSSCPTAAQQKKTEKVAPE